MHGQRLAFISVIALGVLLSGEALSAESHEHEPAPTPAPHVDQPEKPKVLSAEEKAEITAKAVNVKVDEELPPTDNLLPEKTKATEGDYVLWLDQGRKLRKEKDYAQSEKLLARVMDATAPKPIKMDALLELGLVMEDSQQYTRGQQVYAQFLRLFPEDPRVPEVYLRQGLIYRGMGAPNMALSKFYAVMSTALSLKYDHMEHYQRLVLRAQTEIADTYYLQGKYSDAAEFFSRLLKLNDPALNRAQIASKLIRTLSSLQRWEQTIAQANNYLETYPESADMPEVRFLLADAFRRLGRNREATAQVMTLLQSQQANAEVQPDVWRYWQQKTGNEIGNQLYQGGDYLSALEIYQRLVSLSELPGWQLPLWYQIGLSFEKLEQSDRAADAYKQVLDRANKLGEQATPAHKLVMDMAKWRLDKAKWLEQGTARTENLTLQLPTTTESGGQ